MDERRFSRAESRVLLKLLQSRTVKEIADELFLSYHTVNRHVANMRERIGVNSITELCIYAYRRATEVEPDEVIRKVGTFCLLALFSAYTFGQPPTDQAQRRVRRRADNEIELLTN